MNMNFEWWTIILPACLLAAYIITGQFLSTIPISHFALQRRNVNPVQFFYPFFHLNGLHLSSNCFILLYCSVQLSLLQFCSAIVFSSLVSTIVIVVFFPAGDSVVGASGLSWGALIFLLLCQVFGKVEVHDSMVIMTVVGMIGLLTGELFKTAKAVITNDRYLPGIVHLSGTFGGVLAWCIYYYA
jgi:membrane associated rhomboid family serine protease